MVNFILSFLMIGCFYSLSVMGANSKNNDEYLATFGGRVSRINQDASLVRVRIDFENAKYLVKNNKVDFWSDTNPKNRCTAIIEGKSPEYLLLRVPLFGQCITNVYLTTGAYLYFYSSDLERNLKVGRDLLDILLKKQMALQAQKLRHKKYIETYPEKVEAVNSRYEVLRQKLELEWKNELAALEEDKTFSYKNFKSTQARLDELNYKIEKYKLKDHNLKEDRWALDPKMYITK